MLSPDPLATVAQANSRARWWSWFLLLPLPGLALAMWRQGLLDNIDENYLWMVMGGLVCIAAVAVGAWWLTGKRWGRAAVPTIMAMTIVAAFVYYAGAAATLSALLLAITALAAGSALDANEPGPSSARLLVGLALIAGVLGWLLPFRFHDPRLYLLLVGAIGLLHRHSINRQIGSGAAAWRLLAEAHPLWLVLVVAGAAVASLGLWLPSLNYDDNASHLILADQLLANGYYRLDVSSQVWAVAPWSNNVLHGVAALLAGQEARASVNVLWLLVGISGAYRLALAVGGTRPAALAASAVFASHPLTAYFGSTMQVDGVVAGTLLHFAADLVRDKGRIASPLSTGALLGLLAGLKTSNVIYVFLPLLWLGWNAIKHRELSRLLTLVLVAAAVGGSSYAYATFITGNPVFPLFNAIFQSPYMPLENFHDSRWDAGMDWRSLWDLTFNTTRFAEAYPGAAGIALLALLPALVLEMLQNRPSRWVGFWLLVSGVLMFAQIQYLRYVFPAIAILCTLGVVGLSRFVGARAFALAVALVVLANFLLMPTTSWIARANPWDRLVKQGVSANMGIEKSFIPERALLERLHAGSPQACVLMSDQPFVAGFAGRANAMGWYDPRLSESRRWAEADLTGNRWQQVLRAVGASHIVLTKQQPDTALMKALASIDYIRVDGEGAAEVWAAGSPEVRQCSGQFQRQRDHAHRLFHPDDQHP